MRAHGSRATASTLLNESGVAPDLIELQLAHAERKKVRAAYNRAQRLAERRKLMQRWADYLDELRMTAATREVVPVQRHASWARPEKRASAMTSSSIMEQSSSGRVAASGRQPHGRLQPGARSQRQQHVQAEVLPLTLDEA